MFTYQKILIISGVMLLLAACSVPNPYVRGDSSQPPAEPPASSSPTVQTQPSPPMESTTPAETLPPPAPARPRTLGPAAKALVAQARTQLNAGNDALAASTIERALRIEPNNPLLWIELAKVRQTIGNAAQAENLARKALAMAVGDTQAQAAAWKVIADTFRARGRNPEARDADARASVLIGG